MIDKPKIGSRWRHRNGNVYGVLLYANVDSTRPEYPEMINYMNIDNNKVYARRLDDWHRSMTEIKE